MKLLGQLLLWAGFLSGALATVSHSPKAGVESLQKGTSQLQDATQVAVFDIKGNRYTLLDDEAKIQSFLTKEREELNRKHSEQNLPLLTGELDTVERLSGFEEAFKLKHEFDFIDVSAVTPPSDGWHLIPWVWYLISAAGCVVGIVLLFKSRKSDAEKSQKSKSSLAQIQTSFGRLISNINQLASETDTIPPSHIVKRIDEQLADDFRVIADGRDNITAEYGLDVFADVMTQFAAGERSINRAWSAAADGYMDEAETCIKRSRELISNARSVLQEASDNS